jgi:hypothetical protein
VRQSIWMSGSWSLGACPIFPHSGRYIRGEASNRLGNRGRSLGWAWRAVKGIVSEGWPQARSPVSFPPPTTTPAPPPTPSAAGPLPPMNLPASVPAPGVLSWDAWRGHRVDRLGLALRRFQLRSRPTPIPVSPTSIREAKQLRRNGRVDSFQPSRGAGTPGRRRQPRFSFSNAFALMSAYSRTTRATRSWYSGCRSMMGLTRSDSS